ncbi:ubiquinol-cytochrome C chaperone family protein [Caulobacter sp. 17J80-11]|uniref:ubiquinol-cytochrome C chaperone family protein n=1 Tax=Caulobacter sp. 17J80-11 TaxID=2763502 RepID=UPI001653965A|nr:ubiquinol-cytochrome C chaperone family protein [Caulobacter sp. 17J80-11]MBC6980835.1 ubiquinol-cytochrome C reductase [Caulobacter sp. 17J80-11]
MLHRLLKPRAAKAAGTKLYAAAVAQARQPEFYLDLGVEDRVDARFELYTLHVVLLVERLKDQGEQAAETSEALFETYVSALDDSLREMGVGDLSLAKKIRKLGEALMGRTKAYVEALDPEPDSDALTGIVARNVFSDEAALERAAPVVDYIVRAHDALAAQPLKQILEGRPAWPQVRQ